MAFKGPKSSLPVLRRKLLRRWSQDLPSGGGWDDHRPWMQTETKSQPANSLPVGDYFSGPETPAVVFLLLWIRAYHSRSKSFVLLYKHATEHRKDRIRNT